MPKVPLKCCARTSLRDFLSLLLPEKASAGDDDNIDLIPTPFVA